MVFPIRYQRTRHNPKLVAAQRVLITNMVHAKSNIAYHDGETFRRRAPPRYGIPSVKDSYSFTIDEGFSRREAVPARNRRYALAFRECAVLFADESVI